MVQFTGREERWLQIREGWWLDGRGVVVVFLQSECNSQYLE